MKSLNLLIAHALRSQRTSAGLSQRELCLRTQADAWPLHPLTPSQVSKYETGVSTPMLPSLVSLLVVCSPDGATLDFGRLQETLLEQVHASARELVWLHFGGPRASGSANLLPRPTAWQNATSSLEARTAELERRVKSLENRVVGEVMGWQDRDPEGSS